MRTTLRMNDGLRRQVQELAEEEQRTFTSLMEEAATLLLSQRRRRPTKQKSISLPTFQGQGLQPGVDLDNNAALLDHLEEGLPLEKRR